MPCNKLRFFNIQVVHEQDVAEREEQVGIILTEDLGL